MSNIDDHSSDRIPRRTYRIAARARILYVGIPALAIVVLLLIGNYISNEISSDLAQRLARQYSIEAAANFQSSTSPHFVLMRQLARSTTISRWLADENDLEKKARAFEEIMGYAAFAPDIRIMFTVYDTLHGYDFYTDLTSEDFVPWGTLAGGYVSQWFYNTRDAEKPFNINIQRERPELVEELIVLYIWSNHRMYYQEEFVGVVTVGSPFSYVFDAVFANFDVNTKRGYIIDNNGKVRADSAELLVVTELGLPTLPFIPEALEETLLYDYINDHLQLLTEGYFQLNQYIEEAIPLSGRTYRYGSISPIVGTNWSVVVLSSHVGIFDARFMPMVIIGITLLIISILVGSILVRRSLLEPLYNLTQSSAAAASIEENSDIFGLDRKDEIGDLARTIQFMRVNLKKAASEMQRIEVAEESNRAKSRFLARISHELRTPIATVLGVSEIQLQNSRLPMDIEESFDKIHNSAQLLLSIINDLLDLSKIEARKMSLQNKRYEVTSMISDAISLHLAYIGDKDIDFRLKVDENLPAFLIGDSLRIVQIVNNLVSNAFKYTDSGSVVISIKCEEKDSESIILVISVKDTGFGMTTEQLSALRDEYTRFHEHEHNFIGGTGLGMPIVYNLAEMMNAEIELCSKVGNGTTVTIRIPQKKAGTEVLGKETALRLQQYKISVRTASKRFNFVPEPMPYGRVLVVDDTSANLFVAQRLLEFYQIDTETCSSGQEAIAKIKQGKVYDIVFMDHMMPVLNGVDTLRIIRDIGYKEPVIALTANAIIGQAEEFLKIGFDGFISKPIQAKRLNSILIKYIKDKQPPGVIEEARANANYNEKIMDGPPVMDDLTEMLRSDFARTQADIPNKIREAIQEKDVKAAHLMAHTLKGIAGLVQEDTLAQIAGHMEYLLVNGRIPSDDQLTWLEKEMERVIDGIQIHNVYISDNSMTKDQMKELFDKLIPMLEISNAECIYLLDELRAIPEAAILVKHIEEFEFAAALRNLNKLREALDTSD